MPSSVRSSRRECVSSSRGQTVQEVKYEYYLYLVYMRTNLRIFILHTSRGQTVQEVKYEYLVYVRTNLRIFILHTLVLRHSTDKTIGRVNRILLVGIDLWSWGSLTKPHLQSPIRSVGCDALALTIDRLLKRAPRL